MLSSTLLLSSLVAVAVAQDFSVPSSWREFSESRTRAQRISLASAGINQITLDASNGQYDAVGFWPTASTVLSAMANYDHFTNSTTYKTQVTNAINKAFSLYTNFHEFQYNDDSQWWSTAAYYAYRAYGDQNLLNHAIANWNYVSKFQITQAIASSGQMNGKSFTVKGSCGGQSMVGGVFWRPVSTDASVNSVTTGLFMSLSAYLAQATGDSKYTTAAYAAGTWIRNANKNSAGLVLDTINGQDCTRSDPSWIFTYNSGKYVEGLTALYAVTKNNTLMTEATNVAVAGMKNAPWQGSNGVITEGASPSSNNDGVYFKSVWVRALNELFRTATNSQLNILLHSYLVVQYNALLELAATGSTYSSSWVGPPQGFTGWGQAAALDNLVTGITSTT